MTPEAPFRMLFWVLFGGVLAAVVIIGPVLRIPKVEQMLLEEFSADYRACVQRTGRLFSK